MNKLKPKQILLADAHKDMLAQLRQRLSHFSEAETIRYCIAFAYGKHFKDYVEMRRKADPMLNTPEMKVKQEQIRKDMMNKARQSIEDERGKGICDQLDGTVVDGMCRWKVYSLLAGGVVEEGNMSMPLSEMEEYMVENQYTPSKEEVINANKTNDAGQ